MLEYDAIYARQSVDRMDSISIESQIEYCKYEARGNIGFFKTKGIVEKIRIVRISRSCLKQSEGER